MKAYCLPSTGDTTQRHQCSDQDTSQKIMNRKHGQWFKAYGLAMMRDRHIFETILPCVDSIIALWLASGCKRC